MRFWLYRVGRLLFVAIPIVAAVYVAFESSKSGDRDEARKYQACTQRFVSNTILRDGLLSARERLRVMSAETDNLTLRARYEKDRTLNLRRAMLLEIPDCRKSYPRGFAESSKYPDLVPVRPSKVGQ